MRCLCCNKEIDYLNDVETSTCWHQKCVKRFFGTDSLPLLELDEKTFKEFANKTSENGYTIPGVQKKISLHLSKEAENRLTLVGYPTGYILKPQTADYEMLPENECMVMHMANAVGIKTVPFALIKLKDSELAYITRRIDRNLLVKYPMEDFCQLDNRLTEDKYKGSYERCAKIIEKYSCYKKADTTELFIRVVFAYLVGNSDMHLKNLSLISFDNLSYKLSDAYDMLSVKIVLNDEDDLALNLNGKKRNLRRGDFLKFSESIGLDKRVSNKLIDRLISKEKILDEICDESYLKDELKIKFKKLLNERIEALK